MSIHGARISTQLIAVLTGVALCSTLALAAILDTLLTARAQREIGREFSELAIQTTDKLDRSLFERYREIGLIAGQPWLGQANADRAQQRRLLDDMQKTYRYYAWLGVTDRAGRVTAAAGGLLEGADVAQRPWFRNALGGVHLTDVHEALLLARLLQPGGGEPMRFIDIAFPYHAPDGRVAGVLGAHLSLAWAADIEQSVMQPLRTRKHVDTLVLAKDLTVVMGPKALVGTRARLPERLVAAGSASGHAVAQLADEKTYLLGYSRSQRQEPWTALGWSVVVLQDADAAYAPVAELRRQVLLAGGAIALLFAALGWLLARRITRPLDALAEAARRIEAGQTDQIDAIGGGYREIGVLRSALNSLIGKLQASDASLRQADRRKDEFLATLAHELRNPLAPISSAADLLGMAAPDATQQRRLGQMIARQTRHLTGLIDDLLDVSRITRGQVTLHMQATDLRDVVADAAEQIQPKMAAKEHRFALAPAPQPVVVLGDRKRLVQVVANLLDNAVKYTPAGGHIALTLAVVDGRAVLSVRDSGIGMSSDLIAHAFELFTQERRKTDRSSGGLGVGLALSKRLVTLHEGTLSAGSEGADRGSELIVSLPLLVTRAGADAGRQAPAPDHAGSGALP